MKQYDVNAVMMGAEHLEGEVNKPNSIEGSVEAKANLDDWEKRYFLYTSEKAKAGILPTPREIVHMVYMGAELFAQIDELKQVRVTKQN